MRKEDEHQDKRNNVHGIVQMCAAHIFHPVEIGMKMRLCFNCRISFRKIKPQTWRRASVRDICKMCVLQ